MRGRVYQEGKLDHVRVTALVRAVKLLGLRVDLKNIIEGVATDELYNASERAAALGTDHSRPNGDGAA